MKRETKICNVKPLKKPPVPELMILDKLQLILPYLEQLFVICNNPDPFRDVSVQSCSLGGMLKQIPIRTVVIDTDTSKSA